MNTGADLLINTVSYTPLQITFFALGGAFWVIAYVAVLRGIAKHRVVEIPAAAVVCNMAWETTWGLIYRTDLGTVFVWGYRLWFVLDLFIFGFLLLEGARHIKIPELRRWFRAGVLFSFLAWLTMLYFFVGEGYDTSAGLTSGFIATLLMSALYVLVQLAEINAFQFSRLVAWSKLLGNGFASVFCVMVYPTNQFLLSICAITFVLDVLYLALLRHRVVVSQPSPALA